jgi:hypothetical protein
MAGAEVESLRAVAFFDVFYRPVEEGEFRKDEKSLGIDPNSDFFIGRAEDWCVTDEGGYHFHDR